MKSRFHREVLVLDGHDINELNIVSVIPSIRTIDFIRVDCSRSAAQGNQLPGLITSRSTVNDRLLSRLLTVCAFAKLFGVSTTKSKFCLTFDVPRAETFMVFCKTFDGVIDDVRYDCHQSLYHSRSVLNNR
jgi:hypothetical protein